MNPTGSYDKIYVDIIYIYIVYHIMAYLAVEDRA